MEQLAIVASLKSGAEPRAAQLISEGPPFDLEESGLARHEVYLSSGEVVFVFESDKEVAWLVDDLVDDPFQWPVLAAFDAWRPLIEGDPRIARPAFVWNRRVDSLDA
jgi:hypothetical protein